MNQYGVTIPGSPRLEPGMTVTAFLKDGHDWQTLLGWIDHDTGEIVATRPSAIFVNILIAVFVCAMLRAMTIESSGIEKWLGAIAMMVAVWVIISQVSSWFLYRRVLRLLRDIQNDLQSHG
jgi:hypothetical protein